MIDHHLTIVIFVVATGSVFQLEGSGREKQSYADKQEQDCNASKPRSGAFVLHMWIDDGEFYRFTREGKEPRLKPRDLGENFVGLKPHASTDGPGTCVPGKVEKLRRSHRYGPWSCV